GKRTTPAPHPLFYQPRHLVLVAFGDEVPEVPAEVLQDCHDAGPRCSAIQPAARTAMPLANPTLNLAYRQPPRCLPRTPSGRRCLWPRTLRATGEAPRLDTVTEQWWCLAVKEILEVAPCDIIRPLRDLHGPDE